jgi:uncharacterized protein YgbK (DUF1537 family)
MPDRWLIVADDLTGAADSGVAFAQRGWVTEVFWGETPPGEDTAVWAFDADSRSCAPGEAGRRHRDALRRCLTPDRLLYKKIDSTLRGQPAAEIAALSATLQEFGRATLGLFAPANPAMGRSTLGGYVFVRGEPLERTETWRREHSYENADLAAILASSGLRPIKLPLAQVRAEMPELRKAMQAIAAEAAHGPAPLSSAIPRTTTTCAIADARAACNRFLHRHRRVGEGTRRAGSATGTARHQAQPSEARNPDSHRFARAGRRALRASSRCISTCGQYASTQRGAADRHSAEAMFAISSIARVISGHDVVALPEPVEGCDSPPDPRQVRIFAATLAEALEYTGALIVSGGETAAALLAQCQVHGIRLLGEIEPGLALGMTRGKVQVPIVTKPGAFGDENCLIRCFDRMRELGQTE